jgi:hypothetical protein
MVMAACKDDCLKPGDGLHILKRGFCEYHRRGWVMAMLRGGFAAEKLSMAEVLP